jgi:AraC-like DNA-binding protein
MNFYQEFPPHPALARHVACLWASRTVPDGESMRHRVLPDNCIDILWQDRVPLGFAVGMMSRPFRVVTAEPVLTVAVRFLPGAARAFLNVPLHELQDGRQALDDLWPRTEAEALAGRLWEREQPVGQRLATLERALLARLPAGPAEADRLGRAAVQLIDSSGGAVRIEQLARTLGVSRQHLALQFRERIGLNAKTYAMVSRFRRASAELRRQPAHRIDWARLASDCGYYDQSHLIHAFRLFADETPEAFADPRA